MIRPDCEIRTYVCRSAPRKGVQVQSLVLIQHMIFIVYPDGIMPPSWMVCRGRFLK